MINVIIIGKTQEEMQGIIRGIEAVDTEHCLGIIHGNVAPVTNPITEVEAILAEATNAVVLVGTSAEDSPLLAKDSPVDVKKHKIMLYGILLPKENMSQQEVIDHFTNVYNTFAIDVQDLVTMYKQENNIKV